MKKILSLLAVGMLTASASSSVAGCSEKTLASLNDKSYLLTTTKGEDKYDVMRWSNDVLTADAYKKEFIDSYKKHVILADDPWTKLELIKGHQGDIPASGSSTLISRFITDYQKSSNTGDKTEEFIYDQELTYKIYDENNNDNLITSFNDESSPGKWKDGENSDLTLKQEGDVFVVHFKVAIETPISSKFIGARQNITKENKDQLKNYYKDLDESKVPETSAFDYRYDIQFYFSFS